MWFGENVGGERPEEEESVFHELRQRWKGLVERNQNTKEAGRTGMEVGVLDDEDLRYGPEAVELRIECTRRVRQEVLKVRRLTGLPDEDPKQGLVETWKEEGGKKRGKMQDGSLVGDL